VHDGLVVVDTVAAWLTFSRTAVTAGDAVRYGCLSRQFGIHYRPLGRIPFHPDQTGTANPWI